MTKKALPKEVFDTKNGLTNSDGRFLTVENADGKHAVVDWHGEKLVDFVLDYGAAIYGKDCLFTGKSLFKIENE